MGILENLKKLFFVHFKIHKICLTFGRTLLGSHLLIATHSKSLNFISKLQLPSYFVTRCVWKTTFIKMSKIPF